MRTVTFSSDSSRKWPSLWLVGENLDRSWQAARSCWWMFGSVSEHHSHSYATIPHFRLAHLVEIEESATGHAILPMDFSPLSWWDKTYMLQIVLIYHGMKLMNTLCLSHLFFYWCLARKASPTSDTFSLIFSLKDDSARKNCVEFVACCLYTDCSSWFPTHHHFHIQVDFGFNDLFSHIFSFLHHNSVETSWFSHMIRQKPLMEEKSMQSSLDTRR